MKIKSVVKYIVGYVNRKRNNITSGKLTNEPLVNSFIKTFGCSPLDCCISINPCYDNTEYKLCLFKIGDIKLTEIDYEKLELEVINFYSGISPYTFEWSFDSDLYELISSTASKIKIKRITEQPFTTNFSVKVIDNEGCNSVNSLNYTFVPEEFTNTVQCNSISVTGEFNLNEESQGTITIPFVTTGKGLVSFNIISDLFTGNKPITEYVKGNNSVTFNIQYNGEGVVGNHTITVVLEYDNVEEECEKIIQIEEEEIENCSAVLDLNVFSINDEESSNSDSDSQRVFVEFTEDTLLPLAYRIRRYEKLNPNSIYNFPQDYIAGEGVYEIEDEGINDNYYNKIWVYEVKSLCNNPQIVTFEFGILNCDFNLDELIYEDGVLTFDFYSDNNISSYEIKLFDENNNEIDTQTYIKPYNSKITFINNDLLDNNDYYLVVTKNAGIYSKECTFYFNTDIPCDLKIPDDSITVERQLIDSVNNLIKYIIRWTNIGVIPGILIEYSYNNIDWFEVDDHENISNNNYLVTIGHYPDQHFSIRITTYCDSERSIVGNSTVGVYNEALNNFLYQSVGADITVDGIDQLAIGFAVDAFPVVIGGTAEGFHAGFTGTIGVIVSAVLGVASLNLYKNGIFQETLPVTVPNTYTFGSLTYALSDYIEIIAN